mmetsp:Transcript_1069/g.2663  ORF Transcript_1069/g.2663 Transcript_1069/m.2663 type:complete len:408 (+) Transcript_1069:177-1400(+)
MNASSKTTKANNEAVPIFLRKTYHMIDTCDANVACWSEDGETFVVKNTEIFERSVIPQFFKHSKFSSFVRQLNFYGFRKIKYADTIRIDPKLEAETANFWRFRHEKFQRGKPELLIDIKRSNGQHSTQTTTSASSSNTEKKEDTSSLKNEVNVLKKRIEDMTKNIDELTSLVQKVTLGQEQEKVNQEVGAKRKKVDSTTLRPEEALSTTLDLDDFCFPPSDIPSIPPPQQPQRESSLSSSQTDDDFVDQLFTAFGTDDMTGLLEDVPMPSTQAIESQPENENAPPPKLMKKLSDALALLPKEIQEMIVDRLVAAITGTESIEKNVRAASALSNVAQKPIVPSGKVAPAHVPPSPVLDGRQQAEQLPEQLPMPLAAATLAALLTHVSSNIKDKSVVQKPLPPVIPIHA